MFKNQAYYAHKLTVLLKYFELLGALIEKVIALLEYFDIYLHNIITNTLFFLFRLYSEPALKVCKQHVLYQVTVIITTLHTVKIQNGVVVMSIAF